ncbi:MAG TPA: hypothetical protein VGE35_02350 [Candidatus Paceibacterota bacterium]
MSKHATIKALEYELDIINRQIDMKIITGRPYKKDSLRHKFLLAQLRTIRARDSFSLFGKLSHSFSALVF